MDKQDQTTEGKFEGGIFSGTVMEEKEEDRELPENHYFNNASIYIEKPGIPVGEPPAEPVKEKTLDDLEFSEEIESLEGRKASKGSKFLEEPEGSEEPGEPRFSGERGFSKEPRLAKEPAVWKEEATYDEHKCSEKGWCRCRSCPYKQKSGQTVLVIISLTAIAALVIAFLVVVCGLVTVSLWKSGQSADSTGNGLDGEKRTYFEAEEQKEGLDKEYGKKPLPETGGSEEYYGEITDAVRTDLDYSIEWKNYEYEGNNDNVTIAVDYPVIEGNVPNLDVINDIIDDETEYFEEYYKEYSKYMMPEENFLVYSEGYVTFMDQEVMSVVFCEMIYTDYWADYGLYCLNIDMENGVVLDNNSIMAIDDEFAVDFRKRCRQQNGTVSDLDSMTDQEIVYYLTSGGTSILFYTPLGMEVGLNMGEYYVTVTYKDYEKFLQRY